MKPMYSTNEQLAGDGKLVKGNTDGYTYVQQ